MSARTLANTRFVVSPLSTLITGLFFGYCPDPAADGLGLGARIQERLRRRELTVLAGLFSSGWSYLPDFVHPHPTTYHECLDRELHAVTAVGSARIAEELEFMLASPRRRLVGQPPPSRTALLRALDGGEQSFAERVATEMEYLWTSTVEPLWPGLRARIEGDIKLRARTMARSGSERMLGGLSQELTWAEERLQLDYPLEVDVPEATSVTLSPSVIGGAVNLTVDPLGDARPLIICYPAHPAADEERSIGATELLGASRARILEDLTTPRTTSELARRHWLTPSTVSHHLGALHRAGLVGKVRERNQVFYQRTDRGNSLTAGR